MTAKEMFEKLGYKQTINKTYTLEYRYFTYTKSFSVKFRKDKKRVYENGRLIDDYKNYLGELGEAINKQVEELGW